GLLLCAGAVVRGPQFRAADRIARGPPQLHSLRRLVERTLARCRGRDRPVLAGMDADLDRARHLLGGAVRRGLYSLSQVGRRECRAASGLDDVCNVCLRLSVRLCRAPGRGAGLGRDWRSVALRVAALSRERDLHRWGGRLVNGVCPHLERKWGLSPISSPDQGSKAVKEAAR